MGIVNWFQRVQNPPKPVEQVLPERASDVTARRIDRDLSSKLVDLVTSTIRGIGDEEASSIAKACIRKVAIAASSVPLILYDKSNDNESSVDSDRHPILRLLDSPNNDQSRAEFVMTCMQQVQRNGRCIIVCMRSTDGTIDLVCADATIVTISVDEYDGVLYTVAWPEPFGEITYAKSDIIDWQLPAISGFGDAEGPWQITKDDLEGDGNARKWQHTSMGKRLLPDGVFSLPSGTSKAVVDDFKRQVENKSGNESARQVLVATGDVVFQGMSSPPAEADFIETRKFYRDQICAVFGVPPPVLGFMENATLANLDASRIMMWEDTVLPYLDLFCGALTQFINDEFSGVWQVRPDVTGVPALRVRTLDSADAAVKMVSMGVPFDRVNERLDLGIRQYDGDSVGVMDANKIPLRDALGLFDTDSVDGY